MTPLLPSVLWLLGGVAVVSAQAPKPNPSDFWARPALEAPKPKVPDFWAPRPKGDAETPKAAAPNPATAVPAPPDVPPTITAHGSDGLVAERVRIVHHGYTLTAARIELRGTGLSRDDLARLLDPATPGDLRARLTALRAREIVVPALVIADRGGSSHTATLRDIRFTDVAEGRVGAASAGPGSASIGTPDKPGNATLARLETSAFDLGHLLDLAAAGPGEAGSPPRSLFASFAVDGLAFDDGDGTRMRVARIAARDYRARRTANGLPDAFERVIMAFDKDGPAPGASNRAMAATADLLGAFEIGGLELVSLDFQVKASDVNGRSAEGGDPSGRIARMSLAAASGTPGSFRLDGLEATNADGTTRIAAFALDDVSLRSLIDGMAAMGRSEAAIGPGEARRLIPQVGAIRLGRVEVAQKAGAASSTLDALDITGTDLLDGLPTRVRVSLRNLSTPVGALSDAETIRTFADFGITEVSASIRADLGWNESSRQLAVHELAVEAAQMGVLTLRAVVGNVPRALFGADPRVLKSAFPGLTAESLDIDIQDRGLLDRVLAIQAKEKGGTVENLREEVAAMARLGIPALLGTGPGATDVARAVAGFVMRPGHLAIRATASRPGSVTAADIAAAADPATLLGRFTLTATTD